MTDPLTPAVSDRICRHMNEDHAEAIALYATVFGQKSDVDSAQMQAIDTAGIDLAVIVNGQTEAVRIAFDHPLKDSEDAHQTLISLVKQARAQMTAKA